ncbi:MAG: phytoene dehydrogenase [Cyclobacteriaceae bacterium]|nr:MAG: phytoene dehydrogenase [Cyclobacteriaceae bacterium]
MNKVVVIGSGFSGLSAACCLAQQGYQVTVLEKNHTPGGRARRFKEAGYTFDMGPSWYWMPDVFERFFKRFDLSVTDYYQLKRLDPSYRMFFNQHQNLDVPADYTQIRQLFESIETGSAVKLDKFMKQAELKYQMGMGNFVYKPGNSAMEFINLETIRSAYQLDLFQSFHQHLRRFFSNPKLLQLLTFPILFLGATAKNTPALYSLMNFADLKLGTWYPKNGMHEIVLALVKLAESLGVSFKYRQEVHTIDVKSSRASKVITQDKHWNADLVVASADYHFIESECLPIEYQSYTDSYWESRTMAPSSLIYYLGVRKRIDGLQHHNLFFDADLNQHTSEIYETPKWPSNPLFYVSATSKTDATVCPTGHENLFVLIPVAPGLEDNESVREHYFDVVMKRMERALGTEITAFIDYRRCYAHQDFIKDYHAFKGNAYGLANTTMQTAFLKPGIKSKKVSNLYYAGQLTVPGPGVPPSLISGQIVANQILKDARHETVV